MTATQSERQTPDEERHMSSQERKGRAWASVAISGGSVLAALQVLWHYVANVFHMEEAIRTLLKEVTFGGGITLVLGMGCWFALSGGMAWMRRTVYGVSTVMLTALLSSNAMLYLLRGSINTNSAFLGAPLEVRIASGAVAILLYVLLPIIPVLLLGFIARRLLRQLTATA
jgi:hypothetical protein